MDHLDAKAIRDRLNAVMIALATLSHCTSHDNHLDIALAAQDALQEIAALVLDDELEENGSELNSTDRRLRRRLRLGAADGTHS